MSGKQQTKEEKKDQPRALPDEQNCRCRETSEMKPKQLLKLMISDLAFWKKGKK